MGAQAVPISRRLLSASTANIVILPLIDQACHKIEPVRDGTKPLMEFIAERISNDDQ